MLAATTGQGVPEVKPRLQPVQGGIYPSMMHTAASRRIAMHGNTVVIGTTSATS
jgi:hypothetical protein